MLIRYCKKILENQGAAEAQEDKMEGNAGMKKFLYVTIWTSVFTLSACVNGGAEKPPHQEASGMEHGEKIVEASGEDKQPQEQSDEKGKAQENGVAPVVNDVITSGHETLSKYHDQGWQRADFNIVQAKSFLEDLIPDVSEAAEEAEDAVLTEDLEDIHATIIQFNKRLEENMQISGRERDQYFMPLLRDFRELDEYIREIDEYGAPNTTNYVHEHMKEDITEGKAAEMFKQLPPPSQKYMEEDLQLAEAFVQNDTFRQAVLEASKQQEHFMESDIEVIFEKIVYEDYSKEETLEQLNKG